MKKIIFLVLITNIILYGFLITTVSAYETRMVSINNNEDHIIINDVGIENFSDVFYIENYKYFKHNPKHKQSNYSDNWLGTCTTTAMQLLLGYHNYYTDRRLIPEYDENNERFLNENYAIITSHPLVGGNADGTTLGTEDLVYEKLLINNEDYDVPLFGQSINNVKDSALKFIDDYSIGIADEVTINTYSNYSKDNAVSNLDNNLPVILGRQPFFNEANDFHVMVAYGYANYNNEFGYVVHYGSEDSYVWVPERQFIFMIEMEVNHTHNFVYDYNIFFNSYVELECTICGANTVDKLYDVDEYQNEISNVNYDIDGSLYIPTMLYGTSITQIGDFAFEDCISLQNIIIADVVTSIGDNAFEDCISLEEINIPSSVTSIGDNAFEDCVSLEEINIPSSVTSIGDYAFKNCTSLKTVTINRDDIDITELGMNAFLGCSSLDKINVPGNRILEYMNATNWKNHKLKIESNAVFEEVNINCLSDEELTIAINPSENGILKINIECANSYEITASSDYYIIFKLYDSNMQEINVSPTMSSTECSGVFSSAFPSGIYYISVKYTSGTMSGEALVNVKFNDGTNNYFEYGLNDALEHLHNYDNQLKNSSVYHNNQGAGLYKVSISGDLQSYQNVLTIYDNSNKVEPMKRIETSLYELDAITSMASNNLVVLFQNYTSYYIDIIVPSGTYSSLTLIIEKVEETYEIDLVNGSQTIYNIMNNETLVGDHFVVLEIVEASTISVIYDYTGTQEEFIYFVLFKEVYNNNELKYEVQLVFPEMMVTYGESLEWRSTITAGKHYIGYFNKFNPNSTISISITG